MWGFISVELFECILMVHPKLWDPTCFLVGSSVLLPSHPHSEIPVSDIL